MFYYSFFFNCSLKKIKCVLVNLVILTFVSLGICNAYFCFCYFLIRHWLCCLCVYFEVIKPIEITTTRTKYNVFTFDCVYKEISNCKTADWEDAFSCVLFLFYLCFANGRIDKEQKAE